MKYNSWQDFKPAWLAALRSGEYQQCGGQLWKPDKGYCCFGVAADLLVLDGQGAWNLTGWGQNGNFPSYVAPGGRSSYGVLRFLTPEWFQEALDNKLEGDLISANDSGSPFAVIADLIEKRTE